MARILFVTVGTSAITNSELWKGNGDLPSALPPEGEWGEMIRNAEASLVKERTHGGRVDDWKEIESHVRREHVAFERDLTDLHRTFWRVKSPQQKRAQPRLTSAEAISTWLAGEKNMLDGGPLQKGKDKVVLVLSRTCIGQMAGRINETLFREFLFTGEGHPQVATATVDDLELEGIREQAGEPESLWAQMQKIYGDHSDLRNPLFNITGGFKGLIPAITVICSREDKPMLYMHDTMKGAVRLQFENGRIEEKIYGDFDINV